MTDSVRNRLSKSLVQESGEELFQKAKKELENHPIYGPDSTHKALRRNGFEFKGRKVDWGQNRDVSDWSNLAQMDRWERSDGHKIFVKDYWIHDHPNGKQRVASWLEDLPFHLEREFGPLKEEGEAPGNTVASTGGTTQTTPPESVGKTSFKKFKKKLQTRLVEQDDKEKLFQKAQRELRNSPQHPWAEEILNRHGFKFDGNFVWGKNFVDTYVQNDHRVHVLKDNWGHINSDGTTYGSGHHLDELKSQLEKYYPLKESEEEFKKAKEWLETNPVMSNHHKIVSKYGFVLDRQRSKMAAADTWVRSQGGEDHVINAFSDNSWTHFKISDDGISYPVRFSPGSFRLDDLDQHLKKHFGED